MKKTLVLLVFTIISVGIYSQKVVDFIYMYDEFRQGTVVFRSGYETNTPLNYEMINQKIHFKDNANTVLELAYPETVTYIKIGEDIFVHVKGSLFYQKIKVNDTDLYIEHKKSLISKGKRAGYGTVSSTAAIDNITSIDMNKTGNYMKLDSSEEFDTKKNDSYYLKINGKYKRFHSVASLAKLFEKHEKKIKEGLNEMKINFKDTNDVIRAIEFCDQLTKQE